MHAVQAPSAAQSPVHPTRTPWTTTILNAYFASVVPLLDYLVDHVLEPVSPVTGLRLDTRDSLLSGQDDATYTALLTRSLVATGEGRVWPHPKIVVSEPLETMAEVIGRAQARMFQAANGKPSNIITSGYRPADSRNEHGKIYGNRAWITNYFVNTLVTALKAPEWDLLLTRIGSEAMLNLLTKTSIFVSLPNDCLCQLTGVPLVHISPPGTTTLGSANSFQRDDSGSGLRKSGSSVMKRKWEGSAAECPPIIKARTLTAASKNDAGHKANPWERSTGVTAIRTTSNIPLIRARLFYGRPFKIGKTKRIAVGLPPTHALNRVDRTIPAGDRSLILDCTDIQGRDRAAKVRRLSKYVFPRQFGLQNVFEITSSREFDSHSIQDFSNREEEIKALGPCKTPKRLRWALDLLDKMFRRHAKCGYRPLLDKVCPSKVRDNEKNTLDSSIILELVSEEHIDLNLKTQLSQTGNHSTFSEVSAHGISFAENHSKQKPKFAEFACSHVQVYLYARLVTQIVIPKGFWGCEHNFKLVMTHVKTYISSRRYETLTLHSILQRLSTTECDWLLSPTKLQHQQRPSVAESLKRRELLEEFIYWYFESFLLPLLKTTFYVTESSAYRNRVIYFRQDDWDTLCEPLLDRLIANTFQKVPQWEAEQLLRNRTLGFSFVRLLPKDTGVRPIVNLRRKTKPNPADRYNQSKSINQILQAAFQILSYEKEAQPQLLGASVFGPNEVYLKLKAFQTRLFQRHGRIPKLWFVKLDVQACFDTIEQGKLLEILKKLISDYQDTYVIRRYGQVNEVMGKIRRTYVKKAQPDSEHLHFLTYASQLASLLRHVIFVDQVVYPFAFRDHIIDLLEDHITSNIVKIGQDYYRQMVGIPQGSVLSSILCSFFYGDLEASRLKPVINDLNSTLLRLVDDYFFVTTDLSLARKFLDEMNRGHPDYGCFISRDKTLTNFDHGPVLSSILPSQTDFPWCGYRINMSELSVSADYSRFRSDYVMDSLTVHRGQKPGMAFMRKMMQLVKHKTHMIFCDTTFNSRSVVYANIYENFVLTAMKMHRYLKDWGVDVRTKGNSQLIRGTIRQTIHYTYASIKNKASNGVAKQGKGKCHVDKAYVTWLGTHAFYIVLKRKSQQYGPGDPGAHSFLKGLAFELGLPRYRLISKKLARTTKKSWEVMASLKY